MQFQASLSDPVRVELQQVVPAGVSYDIYPSWAKDIPLDEAAHYFVQGYKALAQNSVSS